MDPIGLRTTTPNYADLGISAEQMSQLKDFFGTTEVSYVDDDGTQVTTTAATLLDEPSLDADQALALLQAVSAKLRSTNMQGATEAIQANKDKQAKLNEERMDKLLESLKAAADAKNSGDIGQAFAWVGVALAIVAAVAASVLTFGAASGASALMVAGCIAAVTGAVLATTTQITSAIPGAMDSMGQEGQKAFMFTMMALQVAAAIVSLGTGAASAVNAAKATTDAAVQATRTMQIAGYVEKGAQISAGVTEVSGGAANIAASEQQADAEYARADLAELGKFLKQLQSSDDKEIDFIKTLQEMNDKAWQIVSGAVSDRIEARSAVTQSSPA